MSGKLPPRRPWLAPRAVSSLAITAFLLIVAVSFTMIVKASGTVAVSHNFSFIEDRVYLLSYPLCSVFNTAADLEAEIQLQNSSLNLKIDVATLQPGLSPSFTCYPVGSTLIDDVSALTANCNTTTASLNFGSREGILLRVREDPDLAPDITASMTWSGTDLGFTTYTVVGGNMEQWISIPFQAAPTTADAILDALVGGRATEL